MGHRVSSHTVHAGWKYYFQIFPNIKERVMVLTDKPHLMCVTYDSDSLHWGRNRLKGLERKRL